MVWVSYHVEGIRAKGFVGYLELGPRRRRGPAAAVPIFVIEVISHFVRLISLSVRLFANILAGHLLILFMGGGLLTWLSARRSAASPAHGDRVLHLRSGLVATLQAFIFATLTAIYLGGAVAESH